MLAPTWAPPTLHEGVVHFCRLASSARAHPIGTHRRDPSGRRPASARGRFAELWLLRLATSPSPVAPPRFPRGVGGRFVADRWRRPREDAVRSAAAAAACPRRGGDGLAGTTGCSDRDDDHDPREHAENAAQALNGLIRDDVIPSTCRRWTRCCTVDALGPRLYDVGRDDWCPPPAVCARFFRFRSRRGVRYGAAAVASPGMATTCPDRRPAGELR